jgi:hypothetical protein
MPRGPSPSGLVSYDCLRGEKVNCAEKDHYSIGALVHDIKALSTSLMSFKCYHVSRLCNRVTHVLTK